MSSKRICNTFAGPPVAHGMVFALAVLVGGCSADVTRFDFPFFGLTNKGNETGSLPTPPGSIARFDDAPGAPPRGAGLSDASRGYAPQPYPPAANERVASARDYAPPPGPSYAPTSERTSAPPVERQPLSQPRAAGGESIEVQQGDTLYGIAKRHGVSISALIEANGLRHGASVKPGQQLLLPAGAVPARTPSPPPSRAPTAVAKAPPPAASAAKKGWQGQHTMKAGESLYGIARQHGVTLAELQRVNGIREPTRVRVGAVLTVPERAESERALPPPATPRVAQGPPAAPSQARIINAPDEPKAERIATLGDRRNDASEPAAEPPSAREAAGPKFRWPARGKVIAAFGKRTDGSHNDGINIAVPQGTDVHAAESGRVAYAGNELKGYGNLVLIRHDNGWVSAYAHVDRTMVKRDDLVRRGQVIAKAGKTGTVDQPQLHFELRHGAKPVDPLPHMEK